MKIEKFVLQLVSLQYIKSITTTIKLLIPTVSQVYSKILKFILINSLINDKMLVCMTGISYRTQNDPLSGHLVSTLNISKFQNFYIYKYYNIILII